LQSRLLGLARAHDLLTKRRWEDAPLDFLARELLDPISGASGDRVEIHGPAAMLDPKTALNLTMVLNELATNA
ncbi:MAG: sensor histidine kinase, partial [Mesorhizobium sp.]